ncbi:hypothetical protein J1785_21835 [Rahnella sp. SL6]|uniref:ELKS/Rab6-interacting/CAST family protein n=1 Tax=Rahnella perminowiae TaxID=2816244 RepID=UPI001C27742B|nr:ELKS/Rab6-interacting/CAST family protein [Rahnella perminowiae]MBU9812358.1 hypothetical protein [Rahnella perminowiae]
MTDTTAIAALRNKFGNRLPTPEQARERFTELLNSPHGTSWFLAPYAIALLDALEAERQRAATLQTERDEFRCRLKLERSILEDVDKEIAALKGDQAPVQFRWRWRSNPASAWTYQDMKHYSSMVDADKSSGNNIEFEQLFTTPQKPV